MDDCVVIYFGWRECDDCNSSFLGRLGFMRRRFVSLIAIKSSFAHVLRTLFSTFLSPVVRRHEISLVYHDSPKQSHLPRTLCTWPMGYPSVDPLFLIKDYFLIKVKLKHPQALDVLTCSRSALRGSDGYLLSLQTRIGLSVSSKTFIEGLIFWNLEFL